MHIKLDVPGNVFWITGLAGAGKTSIAKAYFCKLRSLKENVVFLDGDAVREIMENDLGHNEADRIKNAYRISRMCRFLSDQGLDVVCSTMSLYHEIQRWNRENIANYFQVYLRVSRDVLLKRDQKKLYSNSLKGLVGDVVSVCLPFEEPIGNDMVIDNDSDVDTFDRFSEMIFSQFLIHKK